MIRNARVFTGFAVLAVVLGLPPRAAFAWDDAGHRLIALVAWELIDEPTRAAVLHLLKSHDRFGDDFKDLMPQDIREAGPETRNRWLFLQASIWPELARDFTGSSRTRHHQPTWHSIGQPLFLTATDEQALWKEGLPVNLGTQWFPTMPPGEMNIVQALQYTRARLRNPSVSSSDKALALTWVIHLVGDLHQPTRATALFSLRRFREGDRGRSEIPATVRGNLHAYWDGILDSLEDMDLQVTGWLADRDLVLHGEAAATALDETQWMAESVALASTIVYDEALVGELIAAENDPGRDIDPVVVDEGYDQRARSAAARRAMEAGYRLAALLDNLFN